MSSSQADNDGWSTVDKPKKSNNRNRKKQTPHPDWASPLPVVEPIPPPPANTAFTPFMIMLMGLPGSGKSTVSVLLENAMPYKFCRINQDSLGSRKKCESKLRRMLGLVNDESTQNHGNSDDDDTPVPLCPIIDRCNFDAQQRSHWYSIAREYMEKTGQTLPVDIVVLDVPPSECLRRISSRKNHETIHSVGQAKGVISQMQEQWRLTGGKEMQHIRSLTIIRNSNELQDVLVKILNQME